MTTDSPPPTRALLLAAGRGSRIAPQSQGVAKPMLTVDGSADGPSFLDFHAERLAAAGVRELYVVCNATTIGAPIRTPSELRITRVLNPTRDLSESGSGHSMHIALTSHPELVDGTHRLLLMDADIVYSPDVLERSLVRSRLGSRVLTHATCENTGEEVHVFADPSAPERASRQGKALVDTPMTRSLRLAGEATGLVLFDPADHAALIKASTWVITRSSARARSEHEDITEQLMRAGLIEIEYLAEDALFTECDTAEDYAYLTQTVYPRIRERIEGRGSR